MVPAQQSTDFVTPHFVVLLVFIAAYLSYANFCMSVQTQSQFVV